MAASSQAGWSFDESVCASANLKKASKIAGAVATGGIALGSLDRRQTRPAVGSRKTTHGFFMRLLLVRKAVLRSSADSDICSSKNALATTRTCRQAVSRNDLPAVRLFLELRPEHLVVQHR
ncbi:unnamed protein product [Symbiodinium sp. CCMP2592]|nr:unnamed protein product [Symbiodinium sp. CCMP2592]